MKCSSKTTQSIENPEKLHNALNFISSSLFHTEKAERDREALIDMGYIVRDKDTHFFKKKIAKGICSSCGQESTFIVEGGKTMKANCDVELSVDCMELAAPDTEFLLFTGDGDFRYLIEKLIQKGVKVRLFSTAKADSAGDYRLSKRLTSLVQSHKVVQSESLFFTDLNNIRNRIGIDKIVDEGNI